MVYTVASQAVMSTHCRIRVNEWYSGTVAHMPPTTHVRVSVASRTAVITFPSDLTLGRCSPNTVARCCTADLFAAGVALADSYAVDEMILDGDVLEGRCETGERVWVRAECGNSIAGGYSAPVSSVISTCEVCDSTTLCPHGVAALLIAHGYGGVAHKLVEDQPEPVS